MKGGGGLGKAKKRVLRVRHIEDSGFALLFLAISFSLQNTIMEKHSFSEHIDWLMLRQTISSHMLPLNSKVEASEPLLVVSEGIFGCR